MKSVEETRAMLLSTLEWLSNEVKHASDIEVTRCSVACDTIRLPNGGPRSCMPGEKRFFDLKLTLKKGAQK